jgi:hypothetical protein
MSLLDDLRRARRAASTPKNKSSGARKKDISGTSDGKWQPRSTLARYRRKRNAARKLARASRKSNR